MSQRLAGTFALIAFAVCVALGIRAGNGFTTVLVRALEAMFICLVVGSIVGAMLSKMLEENVKFEAEKLKKDSTPAPASGR